MKNLLLLIAAVAIFACSATKKQLVKNEEVVALVPSLELVWETDTLMTTAECVIYDDKRNLIYVANINLNPWEKDGNGFISKIDTLGNIVDLKWVSGLDAPKGLGIFNNSLFVNDIDQIIEIDLSSGNIKGRTKIGGNPTLNDLTIAEDGTLYASGSDSQSIFKSSNGIVEILLSGDLGRPNGLLYEKDRLLMLTNQTHLLESINVETKERTVLADSLGHADGIEHIGNGAYLVSNWQGEIYHLSSSMIPSKILDTKDEKINAADIDYIASNRLLLIPTFFDNRVRAYRLVE